VYKPGQSNPPKKKRISCESQLGTDLRSIVFDLIIMMSRFACFCVLVIAVSAQKMKAIEYTDDHDEGHTITGFCENGDPSNPDKVTVSGTFLDSCSGCEVDGECILACTSCHTNIDGQESIKLPEISLADGCREFQNAGGELRCSGAHHSVGPEQDTHFKSVMIFFFLCAIVASAYWVYKNREENNSAPATTIVTNAAPKAAAPGSTDVAIPQEGSML
jgi:hypothetical protein